MPREKKSRVSEQKELALGRGIAVYFESSPNALETEMKEATESQNNAEDLGPRYSQNDLVEVEPGQGVLLFGGEQDDPFVVISESACERTQEDCAVALWALNNPRVRAMFKRALGKS